MRSLTQMTACSECGVLKTEMDLLEQHIKEEHLDEWQPFSCGYCDKPRFSEWQIREHIVAHHPTLEARIVFTDDEVKSASLSLIVKRSMENSQRHHPRRRSAPRVDSPTDDQGGASSVERTLGGHPLKTPNIVDITDEYDDDDDNLVVVEDGKPNSQATGGTVDEGPDGEEKRDEKRVPTETEESAEQPAVEASPTVTVDESSSSTIIPAASRMRRATRSTSNATTTTEFPSERKRRAAEIANRSLPLDQQSTPREKKKRRKTTQLQGEESQASGGAVSRRGEWLSVPGSSSRWWRCKLCKELASVKMTHVLQKHLSLKVFRCAAADCDYANNYAIGAVKSHINNRHSGKAQLVDDSAKYQKQIDEAFAQCFS